MSFPRYPSYKDSGVEWLGEVPGHWDVDRLKRSTIIAKNGIWGDEPQQDENDIPCVRVADFDRQALRVELTEPTIRNVVEKDRVGRVLSRGDLLLEKSGGGEGQPVGCVVLYDDPRSAVCSNFVARVQTAPGMNSSFWRYVHAAAYAVRLNTRSIKQTSGIQNLDASQYLDERAGFPPVAEQTQIAAFLDRETAKIDELVAEQRRLMELLKEKRQAVISHAVTQGLNPDAPMKPSGIEWLGDVPVGWEVPYFGRLIWKAELGENHDSAEGNEGVPVMKMGNLDRGFVKLDKVEYLPEGIDISESMTLKEGDFLFNTRNSLDLVGKVAIWRGELSKATYNSNILRVAFNSLKVATSSYMNYFFNSDLGLSQLRSLAKGTTSVAAIYWKDLTALRVLLPPPAEQHAIVAHLDNACTQLDTLTTEAQRAIDLLQERRTALISAAVTGQIDVCRHSREGGNPVDESISA